MDYIRFFAVVIAAFYMPYSGAFASEVNLNNIEIAKGFPVVATDDETQTIRRWIVERLSKDSRFYDTVERVIVGVKKAEVSYSSPSTLTTFARRVKVIVMLPPGAKKWSWSNGGTGVEGFEAVFVHVYFKRGGRQAYYFHRNFSKIDLNRTQWE